MSRREALEKVEVRQDTHAGLWLDAFLLKDEAGQKGSTIREAVEQTRLPKEYAQRFAHIRESFVALGERVRVFEAKACGRLVVGLGNKNVLEMGIRLDRAWGVPLLPGSSLKGLASRTAHLDSEKGQGWHRPSDPSKTDAGEHHAHLFGSVEGAGAVIFHDAWWDPASADRPLDVDVMTVHHPDYYQGSEAPTDMDSPVPVSFATTKGTFLVALELAPGADPSWLDAAEAILRHGLEHHGIGAKTNAGYGRMTLERYVTEEERKALAQVEQAQGALARFLERARLVDAGSAKGFVEELLAAELAPEAAREVAEAVVATLGEKFLKKKEDKQYVKDLRALRV